LLKQLRAIAAAIEHHRNPTFAQQPTHLLQDVGEHLYQTGVGLGGDYEQRLAGCIVDPVVGGGRHRQAHLRHMGLGQPVLTVINADVPVHVEEAQGGGPLGHPPLSQGATKLGGPSVRR
jgi:hypothetical protein